MPEGQAVSQMFAGIAHRYDAANHLLSGGIDALWRWRLVREVEKVRPKALVDLATGSGDVAFALHRRLGDSVAITGMDFCEPMLEKARSKQSPGASPSVQFTFGDCMNLPLGNAAVDALTIAFGVRNFENRPRGFAEMLRILKPGGYAFILEFSRPDAWFRPFYGFYLHRILPSLAGWATGKKDAYTYLAGSIEEFPDALALKKELLDSGFDSVVAHRLTFGIVAIHCARKKPL